MALTNIFPKPSPAMEQLLGSPIAAVALGDSVALISPRGGVLRVPSAGGVISAMGRPESVEAEVSPDGMLVLPALSMQVALPEWARPTIAAPPPPAAEQSAPLQIVAGDEAGLLLALTNYARQHAPWWQGDVSLTPITPDTGVISNEGSPPIAGEGGALPPPV
jgi:hypothetical protein